MIRHAESAENVAMHTAIEKLIRREITADQLGETAEAAMLEIVPPNGDSPLSEKGQEQARKLGEYWAPILDGRAGNGGVHFFVSPQIRCMRTASPLITQLFEKHGITAQVLPDLIEVPGLMQKEDQVAFYTAYEKLLSEGKKDEAAAFRQGFKWQACGENVEDLQKEFPWAVFDPKLFPATGPWYDKGWESFGEARERADRNVALLRSLQSKMRDGEVVVVVSHGAAMGNIISSLLETEGDFTDVFNTSVSAFHLPDPNKQGSTFSPFARGGQEEEANKLRTRVEFISQTPHLGSDRVLKWAMDRGVMRMGAPAKSRL